MVILTQNVELSPYRSQSCANVMYTVIQVGQNFLVDESGAHRLVAYF